MRDRRAAPIHKLADNLDKRTDEITKGVNLFTAAGTKQINIIGADAHKTLTQVELTFKNLDKNPSRLLFGGTAETSAAAAPPSSSGAPCFRADQSKRPAACASMV